MNSKMSIIKSFGFTLIEVVIVVVIIGFLAVTAIPKLIGLTDQAKQANIEDMAGDFATGVSLVKAKWEAEGHLKNDNDQNSVDYNGSILMLTIEATDIRPGYVTGLTDGALLGESFDVTNCVEIWENILQHPPKITSHFDDLNDEIQYFASKSGSGAVSVCHFYLKESLNRGSEGGYVNPLSSTDTGNSFTYQPASSTVTVYIEKVSS